ncbi:MAG: glycosyltransferase [Verrucomicrobia bacterium]|nr:MAG: glycosyltransferase [Verrucomicrobiota bacterium]
MKVNPPTLASAPISGLVVTYNDSRHLRDCLQAMRFCQELIVVDLGSTDDCVAIATACGASVVPHTHVPTAALVRAEAVALARHDWILFMDPDEVLAAGIEGELRRAMYENPAVGQICVPFQYCFMGKPLRGTIWDSKTNGRPILFHKGRVTLSAMIHHDVILKDGFGAVRVALQRPEYHTTHYWIDSYAQLLEKHRRYLQTEGESRYQRGARFSYIRMYGASLRALKSSLIDFRGYHNIRELFLSFFYAWYTLMAHLSLKRYQEMCEQTQVHKL